jgi:hypothetical protein
VHALSAGRRFAADGATGELGAAPDSETAERTAEGEGDQRSGPRAVTGPDLREPSIVDAKDTRLEAAADRDDHLAHPRGPTSAKARGARLIHASASEATRPTLASAEPAVPHPIAASASVATIPEAASPGPAAEPSPAPAATASKKHQPSPPSISAETQQLRDATQALADGDPTRALQLVDTHARDHGSSALSDVRVALRVEALCALDRRNEAKSVGNRLLRTRPQSPVAERIEASCVGAGDPDLSGHGGP